MTGNPASRSSCSSPLKQSSNNPAPIFGTTSVGNSSKENGWLATGGALTGAGVAVGIGEPYVVVVSEIVGDDVATLSCLLRSRICLISDSCSSFSLANCSRAVSFPTATT